jgi:hypothetical protein
MLPLEFAGEGEVEGVRGASGLTVAQGGLGLAAVVVAVVQEEHDLAADLGLEAPGRHELGGEKASREKSAGLLAETDDRGGQTGDLTSGSLCICVYPRIPKGAISTVFDSCEFVPIRG